jgi:cytoskeletal protein CcmA (bactofilin family)
MFGSKSDKPSQASSPTASPNASNSLIEGTLVEGNIKAPNDIRIDGTLIGNLTCNGRVIIGPQGKIEGNVTCNNAIIEGLYTGVLVVTELLTVKDTGIVNGDITTDKLMVQTGALFNVTCIMGGHKHKEVKGLAGSSPSKA